MIRRGWGGGGCGLRFRCRQRGHRAEAHRVGPRLARACLGPAWAAARAGGVAMAVAGFVAEVAAAGVRPPLCPSAGRLPSKTTTTDVAAAANAFRRSTAHYFPVVSSGVFAFVPCVFEWVPPLF